MVVVVGDFSRRKENRVYVFLAFLFFIGDGNRCPVAALAFALADFGLCGHGSLSSGRFADLQIPSLAFRQTAIGLFQRKAVASKGVTRILIGAELLNRNRLHEGWRDREGYPRGIDNRNRLTATCQRRRQAGTYQDAFHSAQGNHRSPSFAVHSRRQAPREACPRWRRRLSGF